MSVGELLIARRAPVRLRDQVSDLGCRVIGRHAFRLLAEKQLPIFDGRAGYSAHGKELKARIKRAA
jgi:hypothetical protein